MSSLKRQDGNLPGASDAGDRPVKRARLSVEPSHEQASKISDRIDPSNAGQESDEDEDDSMSHVEETRPSDLYLDTVRRFNICNFPVYRIFPDQQSDPRLRL